MQDEEEEAGEEGTSTPIAGGSPKPSAQAKMGGERGVHWGRGNERVPMCKDVSPRATGRPAVGTQPRRGESVSTGPRGRHSGGPDGGNARRSPHPQACKEAQGRARSTRAAGKERCCACAKSHRNPTAALARGGGLGKGGRGGRGGSVVLVWLLPARHPVFLAPGAGGRVALLLPDPHRVVFGHHPVIARPLEEVARAGGAGADGGGGGGSGAAFPPPPPR